MANAKKNPIRGKVGIVLIVMVIFVIAIFWIGSKGRTIEIQESNNEETEKLLADIAKHIIIFSEEEPLIVSINNAEELKEQQLFFQNSQNGDILLVYQDKALIYRPQQDVLINVGPVYIANEEQNQ